MTALWVLLGIAGFLALVLMGSLTFYVKLGEEVRVWAGMYGLRFLVFSSAEEPEEKKKKKASQAKKDAEKKKKELSGRKPSERSLSDTVELILLLVRSIVPGAVRLLSRLRFTAVRIAVRVGGEEADKTAVLYGRMSAGIYHLLAALDAYCTLRVKSVDVGVDFVSGETVYDVSFKVKLRIASILGAAVGILVKLAANMLGQKVRGAASSAPAVKE